MIPDTCVAYATAPGTAGLAVLRLSGPRAATLTDRFFLPGRRLGAEEALSVFSLGSSCVEQLGGYRCRYGHLYDSRSGQVLDEAVVTRFKAPHSYTGEDVVEIGIHGGAAVREQVLEAALRAGAVAAGPGEFTQRAFLNGKLDLAQAEAVIDLIEAEAREQANCALEQLQGGLSEALRNIREPLLTGQAQLELALQYPEHEESVVDLPVLRAQVEESLRRIRALIDGYHSGRILKEGLTVTLAGCPNAGKSTLLNALLGEDRAIVTDIPGTTRDTLEERMRLGGYALHLIDTAGLRESEDRVERLGVERSRQAMHKADLVLWLLPADLPLPDHPFADEWSAETTELLSGDTVILPLLSKSDLLSDEEREGRITALRQAATPNHLPPLAISAKQADSLSLLTEALLQYLKSLDAKPHGEARVTSARHYRCLEQAAATLEQLLLAWETLPIDVISLTLEAASEQLAEITGESATDELWKTIFSRFCVGK